MPAPSGESTAGERRTLLAFLVVLAAGWAYFLLADTMRTATVSAVTVLWFACAAFGHRRRLTALRRERPGQTICHFARDFDRRTLDAWVVRATWDALQVYVRRKDSPFPLRATDSLSDVVAIDGEDLDDLIEEISRRAGRTLADLEDNPHFGQVSTTGDIVRLLRAQPLA